MPLHNYSSLSVEREVLSKLASLFVASVFCTPCKRENPCPKVEEFLMDQPKCLPTKTNCFGFHDGVVLAMLVFFHVQTFLAIIHCPSILPKFSWCFRWPQWRQGKRESDIDYPPYCADFPPCFPKFSEMNFGTGRTNLRGVRACRTIEFIEKEADVHLSILLSRMSSSGRLSANSVSISSKNLKDSFINQFLADLKPIWKASKCASFTAFIRELSMSSA